MIHARKCIVSLFHILYAIENGYRAIAIICFMSIANCFFVFMAFLTKIIGNGKALDFSTS